MSTGSTNPARRRLLFAVAALVASCVLAIACLNAAVYAFKVPSPSMFPTLGVGEVVGAWRWDSPTPEHGAIVVFAFPADPSKDFIQRVVGMPGDRVLLRRDGAVEVNGVALRRCELGPWPGGGAPQRHAFLEWDARRRIRYLTIYSSDPADREPTGSEFCTREACTVPQGHLFVLGDNRDNSYDGRYWGFVPIASLRARMGMVLRSLGDSSRNGTDVEGLPALPPDLHAAFGRCSNQ